MPTERQGMSDGIVVEIIHAEEPEQETEDEE